MASGRVLELEHAIGISDVQKGLLYHPDGLSYIHAAGSSLIIGSLVEQHVQRFFLEHDGTISALDLSASGRLVASGQRGGSSDFFIWCYESKEVLHRLSGHDFEVTALGFSGDELLLCTAAADDNKMIIWDVSTGDIVSMVNVSPSPCLCMAWGNKVRESKQDIAHYQLCTGANGSVSLWAINPYNGETTEDRVSISERGFTGRNISCLAYAFGFEAVYCATTSGYIGRVSVSQRLLTLRTEYVSHTPLTTLEPLRHGGLIVGGTDGTVTVLDKNMKELSQVRLPGAVHASSLMPVVENELLAVVSTGSIFRIRVPDLSRTLLVSDNHFAAVRAVAYTRDTSESFSTASSDRSVRIWDTNDYRSPMSAVVRDAGDPLCLVYTCELCISGWVDGIIRAHDTHNGSPLWQIHNAHHKGAVTSVVMPAHQRFLVSGGTNGDVRVWDMRGRRLLSHFKEHRNAVSGLALYDDNIHVISCSKDKSFLCWDLRAEKRITSHCQRMGGINGIALSHDQTSVFTVGQEKRLTRWDIRSQNFTLQKDLDPRQLDEANVVICSRAGDVIATGGTSRIIRFWNPTDLLLVASRTAHAGSITGLAFSPDDERLVSVGEDGVILIWNVSPRL